MNYQKIALIDLNSGLCRIHMGRSKDAPIGYAVEPTMQWLADIRSKVDHVIVCLDGPPYFRKDLYPEYKAKRAEPDPELNQVKRDVKARLELDGYSVAQAKGFEADDLLATLAAHPDLSMCPDVRLYTSDKDGAQCCTTDGRVSIYAHNGKSNQVERRDFAWVEKEFGVPPSDMPLLQALMGDTSDNYPGIKSWGVKKSATAIKLYKTLAGMRTKFAADDAACKAELKETPAVVRAFLEHHTEVPLYLELATLRTDVPIDVAPLLVKKVAQPLPVKTAPAPEPSDADDSGFYDDEDCDDEFAEQKRATLVDWNGTKVSEQDNARHAGNDAEVKANIEAGKKTMQFTGKEPPTLAEYKALPHQGMAGDLPGKLSCNYHADCAAADAKMAADNAAGGPLPHTAHHISKEEFEANRKRLANEAMDRALAASQVRKPTEHIQDAIKRTAVAPSASSGESKDSQKTEEPCKVVPPKDAGQTPPSSSNAGTPEAASGTVESGMKTTREDPGASTVASVVPVTQGPKKERTEALATVPAPSWNLSAQPTSMREIVWLAERLYADRALLEYADAGGAAGVVLTIARGREMGLGVAASLDAFHIITVRGKTKPYPKAHFLQALAERDPNCEWIMVTDSSETHATLTTMHRKAGKLSVTYKIERAIKAGYLEGGNRRNWEIQPQNMCEARVKSWGSRLWYAAATFGLPSFEEMQDEQQ